MRNSMSVVSPAVKLPSPATEIGSDLAQQFRRQMRCRRVVDLIEPSASCRRIIGGGALNGRVVSIGEAPPKNVSIIELDSLDDVLAFYKSKAWTDLALQRDKSQKAIRRYVVEVEK